MVNPYHVRLAISQCGDQFRAELFTEDLSDTSGDLLPAKWERFDDDFKAYLAMGAVGLPPDTAAQVGQEMFGFLLGRGENNAKWKEVFQQAQRQQRPVRPLIDATTDEVRDLPYGLLCDHHDATHTQRPVVRAVLEKDTSDPDLAHELVDAAITSRGMFDKRHSEAIDSVNPIAWIRNRKIEDRKIRSRNESSCPPFSCSSHGATETAVSAATCLRHHQHSCSEP